MLDRGPFWVSSERIQEPCGADHRDADDEERNDEVAGQAVAVIVHGYGARRWPDRRDTLRGLLRAALAFHAEAKARARSCPMVNFLLLVIRPPRARIVAAPPETTSWEEGSANVHGFRGSR